jgi:hypothetical protein
VIRLDLAAALGYAARGWHVFPLQPGSKRPACPGHRATDCDRTDPFCRSGHIGWEGRATTNPARITRAWSSRPYGIGIACWPSRIVVVDLDIAKDDQRPPARFSRRGVHTGAQALDIVAAEHNASVAPTYTVRTPSGGTHLYYRAPTDLGLRNSTGILGWLIDTRAGGGYVVAPPTSIDEHAYTVADPRDLAPLPGWLTRLLARDSVPARSPATLPAVTHTGQVARYVAAAVAGETAKVRLALPGSRNHTLFCAAVALGQLVAGGQLDERAAGSALTDATAVHITNRAFTPSEAEATIRSGLRTGARNPRTAA